MRSDYELFFPGFSDSLTDKPEAQPQCSTQTGAQCPISPQLTSNCSPLHGTMRHAISLPHTGLSALLIVFLFIFSILPSPSDWVFRNPMDRKIDGYRRSLGGGWEERDSAYPEFGVYWPDVEQLSRSE